MLCLCKPCTWWKIKFLLLLLLLLLLLRISPNASISMFLYGATFRLFASLFSVYIEAQNHLVRVRKASCAGLKYLFLVFTHEWWWILGKIAGVGHQKKHWKYLQFWCGNRWRCLDDSLITHPVLSALKLEMPLKISSGRTWTSVSHLAALLACNNTTTFTLFCDRWLIST